MIYFFHEFDRRAEVPDARMVEIYRVMAARWQEAWPSNKLIGFFSRKYGLGTDPQYLAIWQLPDFAAFDEWRKTWKQVKGIMQAAEDDFHGAVGVERGKIMDRLAP